ncbi:MAG: ATP synthase F1 subunit gamma [Candidatus Taylorbacteria bacterium CG11_big_fil_rev_8_21_14_0_20_46_11]|uniref:ATP synthase gamma chain n=1 Tax=Candidatus Taylorbacteria bacterium CG11_big_fil_rev_8_21_14_0_20_46_11 TaxID=1975025 RepID=A0A2H0KC49_9BACT|nr:MAG: ATP synthase F1 subunit gamma [Candidatus Taylorbacteria bacterium CG11_big_fil_rev_8_21_14_0_20_46_11]
MATLRTIRLRIKGTKNIKQITRAMEAVSAVKMRKSQQVALAARPYAVSALRLLRNLHSSMPENSGGLSPLLEKRTGTKSLLIVVTSDKGLAGSFNTNVLKKAEACIKTASSDVTIATIGKKAGDYFSKRGRKPVVALTGFGDFADIKEVQPIFDATIDAFTSYNVDEVTIIYTNFLSAVKQEVVVRKLLPFSEQGLEEMVQGIVPVKGRFAENANMRVDESTNTANKNLEYLFEPSPKEIFDSILPALLKIEIYHAILEANASEHSSRMVAMRNATDNATDLIKSYTVSMNKARQSAINKELAEITGGSEALAQ